VGLTSKSSGAYKATAQVPIRASIEKHELETEQVAARKDFYWLLQLNSFNISFNFIVHFNGFTTFAAAGIIQ
jgi:hypothetical protein